jgi:hypothetical protein
MWIFLFVFFFALVSVKTDLHQDLSRTRGILVQEKQALCFPDEFWVIRARLFIPGASDSNLAIINEFKSWFTQFKLKGSPNPPAINDYVSVEVSSEVRDMATMLKARLTQLEIFISKTHETALMLQTTSLIDVPNVDSFPWVTDVAKSHSGTVSYSPIELDSSRKIAYFHTDLPELYGKSLMSTVKSKDNKKIPKLSDARFNETQMLSYLQELQISLDLLFYSWNTLQQSLELVRNFQYPSMLYRNEELGFFRDYVLVSTFKTETDWTISQYFSFLMTAQSTIVQAKFEGETKLSENDLPSMTRVQLDVVTFIPLVKRIHTYKRLHLSVFPFGSTNEYWNSVKWRKTSIQAREVITDGTTYYVLGDSSDYVSCWTSFSFCSICSFKRTPAELSEGCERSIITGQNLDSAADCKTQDVSSPDDGYIKLNESAVMYFDDTPGNLIEACPEKSLATVPLTHSGVLTFNKSCSYTMVNGPFTSLALKLSQIALTLIRNKDDTITTKTIVTDINQFQKHFQEYGWIYIMSVCVAVVLLFCTACCFCWTKREVQIKLPRCCPRRRRIHRRARPTINALEGVEFQLVNTMEPQNRVPSERRLIPARTPRFKFLQGGIALNDSRTEIV